MINKLRAPIFLLFCLIGLISCNSSSSAEKEKEKDNTPSLFETLYQKEKLALTIRTDIQELIDNKALDGNNYQSAMISISDNDQLLVNGEINVRPRGITRRQNCDFPPIMLKVKKEQRDSLKVGKSENIKLVTYCKDSLGYPEWVSKEYLAYKLYNSINEHSFRVKLAEVTYEDINGKYPTLQKRGFLIEPLEELADRLDCAIVPDEQAITSIHKEKYKLLTVYQFMIGNSDWNFTKRHNVRILQCTSDSSPIPVPYDFDYSGLVNADYATPHPMLPIDEVTDRLFQWRGSVEEDFSATLQLLKDKKPIILDILQRDDLLSTETIKATELYLEEFYQQTNTPEAIKKEILKARG